MNTPTTGTAKNPTMATNPPTTSERLGTPSARNRRPGIVYLTIWPAAINEVATPTIAQPAAVPTVKPHTTMAAQTSSAPGSTGTTTPTNPMAMHTATNTSTPV